MFYNKLPFVNLNLRLLWFLQLLLLQLSCLQCQQQTVKGGIVASTIRLTAINNQTSSLIFGSSTKEIRLSATEANGLVIETTTAPLMAFKADNTIEILAQEVKVKK